ncbi:hypothetical protein [Microbulbifer taiwanensis]|uniref:hypothetical protein n=1 Tax=Microbulbifer taiwanensis TaxID=986746 RepID=UPI00361402D3
MQIGIPRPSIRDRQTMADDLPMAIRNGYYGKRLIDGLTLVLDTASLPNGRLLPIPIACGWSIINHWSKALKLDKNILDKIVKTLELEQNKDGNYYDLRSFLVHFPSDCSDISDSDVLFLHQPKKQIIHMGNGDIANIRVLDKYSEAIDQYCTHTILNKPERFNFEPFFSKQKILG